MLGGDTSFEQAVFWIIAAKSIESINPVPKRFNRMFFIESLDFPIWQYLAVLGAKSTFKRVVQEMVRH
jgi:hypothetical protein